MSHSRLIDGWIGGTVIGLAAVVLLLGNGAVLGASGIVGDVLLSDGAQQHPWKVALLAAMILATVAWENVSSSSSLATSSSSLDYRVLVTAGLAVGAGTRLGNGCTSGHGICGLARFSTRSLVAVLIFMVVAVGTVTMIPPPSGDTEPIEPVFSSGTATTAAVLMLLASIVSSIIQTTPARGASPTKNHQLAKIPAGFLAGALFTVGLCHSGLAQAAKVHGVLNVAALVVSTRATEWDGTLMFVMGGGLAVSFLGHSLVAGPHNVWGSSPSTFLKSPLATPSQPFSLPTGTGIDVSLVLGAALFGLGWGLAGICPGPAFVLAAAGNRAALRYWWPAFLAGSWTAKSAVRMAAVDSGSKTGSKKA